MRLQALQGGVLACDVCLMFTGLMHIICMACLVCNSMTLDGSLSILDTVNGGQSKQDSSRTPDSS
jgi:hypothetical protein